VAGVGSSAAATYLPGVDERRVGSASFMRGCRIRCVEPRSGTMVDEYRRASSPSLTDGPGGGGGLLISSDGGGLHIYI
jgi:hypothetical protein